jgi:C4-dicarboxylate-specific signal transduction histidine kinase
LAQAGLNLVLNAAEAAEGSAKPEVKISVHCDADWVYLAVEDSGPGVPEELRTRIFEPFYTSKPMGKGTGLGLPVSRELIRAAGGELMLAPERSSLGGAKFVIRAPKARCEGPSHGQSTCQCADRR